MDFSLSQTLLHWSFECEEGSIPFTNSTSPPFSLNNLPLRWSCEVSDSHYGFKGLYLRFGASTNRFFVPIWLLVDNNYRKPFSIGAVLRELL